MAHHFARSELAVALSDEIMGRKPWTDHKNGLFLAAPRRTGKTTFLLRDLVPVLNKEAYVIYTDLWADPSRNPMLVVKDAMKRSHVSMTLITGGAIKQADINIGGLATVTLGSTWIDEQHLAVSLKSIQVQCQRPVVLIIDEAQHALSHPEGMDLMLALKSARDQINTAGEQNLQLVMSGSDRDKLMRLVHGSAAPFYGSQVASLPLLGREYLEDVARLIKASTTIEFVDMNILGRAFELLDHRPQILTRSIGEAANPVTSSNTSFNTRILDIARAHRQANIDTFQDRLASLPTLDRAIIERIGASKGGFPISGKQALAAYSEATGENITPQRVQKALHRLRDASPPLLWKSAVSEYAIADSGIRDWIRDGQPPSVPPSGRLKKM